MVVDYKKEFFDRTYTTREAYGRVWKYARPYRFRIVVGILCGILTAGTLLPLFQVVQPALEKVSARERAHFEKLIGEKDSAARSPASAPGAPTLGSRPPASDLPSAAGASAPKKSRMEREMERAARLPSWFPKAERLAGRLGLRLQDESGAMGGALLIIAIVIIPLVALARLGLVFLSQYCLAWAATKTVTDLRVDILRKIQAQSLEFHGRIDVGQLMMRATGDPMIIQQIIQSMLAEVARAPFEILAAVGFIVWFAISNHMVPTLILIFIGMPAFMLPVRGLGKRIRRWSRKSLENVSVVGSSIHEILTCVRVVKAYDTEAYENAKYAAVNHKLLGTTLRAVRWGLFVGPVVETIGILLLCGFLVWCFSAEVTLANVLPMLAPLLLIYKPIKQMSNLQVSIENAQASLQRIWSVLDVEMELPAKPGAVAKASFDDRVRFEGVTFRYATADRDAVSDVTFEIPRGKTIAVVGGTGSGKTTLSGLLARFFDPQKGRVTMDGVDLRDLDIHSLRRLVGSVQQETMLFNDTIEENIRYGSPLATHEQVVAAAKLAKAHDFIVAQPGGYQRMAGEKGFALSGGERQRVAIARAILRNPPILVLDEATSALDTVTEHLVQEALNNLMRNRTVFAIAHRLSTIRDADLILVLDGGRIVERGTHDELYAANGLYRRLCDMQHQK